MVSAVRRPRGLRAAVRGAVLLAAALSAASASASPASSLVKRLPGYDGDLPFELHAGALRVSDTKMVAYTLVGSERDASRDPVVMWLTGGPGCAGSAAWLQENGPLMLLPGGERLARREAAWSRVATLLHVDQPAGVGYSTLDGPYPTNDTQATADLVAFVRALVGEHPRLLERDWYVLGESYGGVTVPLLAAALMDAHDAKAFPLRLRGYGVGDGQFVKKGSDAHTVMQDYRHGLVSADEAALLMQCDAANDAGRPPNATCEAALASHAAQTRLVNTYNLAGWCAKPAAPLPPFNPDGSPPVGNYDPPCFDGSDLMRFYHSPGVREALHAPPSANWSFCQLGLMYTYTPQTPDTRPLHRRLLGAGKRALVYNGVIDSDEPFFAAQGWVSTLNVSLARPFRVWAYDHPDHGWQAGGASTGYTYRGAGGANLTLVTVLGAGHLVPMDKAVASLVMLGAFLDGVPPGANATCSGGCAAGSGSCVARDVCVCAEGFAGADCADAIPAPDIAVCPPREGKSALVLPVVVTALMSGAVAVLLTVMVMRSRSKRRPTGAVQSREFTNEPLL